MTEKQAALITGASGGIGLELAKLFARDGHELVLVARSEDKLRALAEQLGVRATVLAFDLSRPEAPKQLFEQLGERNIELGYLVNNAGFGTVGKFWELDRARELEMIDLNIRALVELTHLALPGMIARKFGRVLNIGSTAGFQPGPRMATYYASKAFVNHWTEALAHELRGTGVTATVHCPGPTATGFGETAGNGTSKLFRNNVAEAGDVARDAYEAMHAGKVMRIHGIRNAMLAASTRISPRSVVRSIVAKLNE
ncbi:MAG TPA: SDR family oxidoreductase [Enhygromyxa sp.]|nr:SDR family oxidoreductase [Enhygromyxa sp.]